MWLVEPVLPAGAVWPLFVVYVLLQVADAVLTLRVLKAGGREVNPIVNWAMRDNPERGLAVTKTAAVGLYVPLAETLLALVMLTGYLAVVIHNWKQYRAVA